MSEFFNALLGRRDFLPPDEIRQAIRSSKNFDSPTETPETAGAKLIFGTTNQHTWLICTQDRLYCILDDIRKDAPNVNWSIPRKEIINNGRIILEIRARPYSQRSGLVDFGPSHKDWLYSIALFADESVEESIRAFITEHMLKK